MGGGGGGGGGGSGSKEEEERNREEKKGGGCACKQALTRGVCADVPEERATRLTITLSMDMTAVGMDTRKFGKDVTSEIAKAAGVLGKR